MSGEPTTNANDLGSGRTGSPSCHDACQQPFTPVGRQNYCTDACRAEPYRRRRDGVGLDGLCKCCDEAVAVIELLGEEVIA